MTGEGGRAYERYLRPEETVPLSTPGICEWLESEGWTPTGRVGPGVRYICPGPCNHRVIVDITVRIGDTRLEHVTKPVVACRDHRNATDDQDFLQRMNQMG